MSKLSVDLVKLLLSSDKVDVNLKEGGGLSPLFLSVLYNNPEIAALIINDLRVDASAKFEG